MDTVDKKTRSRIMASVGQRDTGPELRLRRILHRLGLRYRLHVKRLPGSPDLVFPKFKAVIFVHGCFWHAHSGCKFATEPASRKDFWRDKFSANQKRDKNNYDSLLATGWRVLVVWECKINNREAHELNELGEMIVKWLKSKDQYNEIG
jgi:DNA mismatch endonuclease (patch repair protein)